MATITGNTARTPRGAMKWRPAAFVAKAYEFYTRQPDDRYVCLGVFGNWSHLTARNPGDHTPFSEHDVWIGGKHYVPKVGTVYAIDGRVPEPEKFEKWFLGRLRAGYYPGVKYFNINNRHWARQVVVAGKPFGRSSRSGDDHLHVSGMPGHEYTVFDFLSDFEVLRTTGRNVGDKPPAKAAPKPSAIDVAARKLRPGLMKGSVGRLVAVAQAALVARTLLPAGTSSIDGDFGPKTAAAVMRHQRATGLPPNGVIDTATWDKLLPEDAPTISRGDKGFYARLMQALLLARGFNPGPLDGDFGDTSVTALKKFQVAAKVKNSVVKGKGDGIGGDATWVALLTL
jgi:peptidoglycan hydrolase-like protein with peptidoglycan-binding domain